MPRKPPGPFWWKARKGWYGWIGGRQHNLHNHDPNDSAGAQVDYERLAAQILAQAKPLPSTLPTETVARAAERFLAHRAPRVEPGTLRGYQTAMKHFTGAFGKRPVCTLSADEIEDWWRGKPWASSTTNTHVGAVQTFLAFAGSPLKLARPPKESRGADTCLSDEQFARVLTELRATGPNQGDLCELLTVLRESGARPQEIAPLTVEGVDWENTCAIRRRHKTWRKTGKVRVIHFSEAAMRVLSAQREKYGAGVLFRTVKGKAYGELAIIRRLLGVSKRLGFRVIAYGLGRHSFVTTALINGVPETVVAALVGHKDTKMIHSNYSHVGANAQVLKANLEKARRTGT